MAFWSRVLDPSNQIQSVPRPCSFGRFLRWREGWKLEVQVLEISVNKVVSSFSASASLRCAEQRKPNLPGMLPRWEDVEEEEGVGSCIKRRSAIQSCCNPIALSPPIRGRLWSSDDGPVINEQRWRILALLALVFAGSFGILLVTMEVKASCGDAAVRDVQQVWSDEAFFFSSASAPVDGDRQELLVCSSVHTTSDVRPLLESADAAVHVDIEASGLVPATVPDDGKLDFFLFLLGGG